MKYRRVVRELDKVCVRLVNQISGLTVRVTALEGRSHTPVPMVTCSTCGSLVAELTYTDHVAWHDSARKRMTLDEAAAFILDHTSKPLAYSVVKVQRDHALRVQLYREAEMHVRTTGDPALMGAYVEAKHILDDNPEEPRNTSGLAVMDTRHPKAP